MNLKKLPITGLLVLAVVFLAGCARNNPSHFFKNGAAQYQLKNYETAIENLDKAISLDSAYKEAYYLRALCKVQMDLTHEALQDFNRAISLDPEFKDAYFNRAYYIFMQQGKYQKAINDFNLILDRLEGNALALALSNRGYCYLKLSQPDSALADITRSLELNGNNAFARQNLGLTRLITGDTLGACEEFSLAVEMGYEEQMEPEAREFYYNNCSAAQGRENL